MPRNDGVAANALLSGNLADPFAFLGPHTVAGRLEVRAFAPAARGVELVARDGRALLGTMEPWLVPGLFRGTLDAARAYLLRIQWDGMVQETEDPYGFGLLLGEIDLHLFNEGRHAQLSRTFGAQPLAVEGVGGVRFAVWAPNARRVAVVGDFNSWDLRRHPMRQRTQSGVWELFLPRVHAGERYKFAITDRSGRRLPLKADPVALAAEVAPSTASIVSDGLAFEWSDQSWMLRRLERHSPAAPMSVYEVHAGSWHKPGHGEMQWDELARRLIPYALEQGFTHIELLPVTVHPFGGSWGYQPLGLFAPDARHGPPQAFARFVDACHGAGLGVILDWVPAHFPTDAHGLWRFDGSALYENEDPREGLHQDWHTAIYNFGRHEVRGFLVASALHWLERYHVDGLRVDAVASMLYRDYSRKPGEWVPNEHGGRENLEAIGFLRHLNEVVAERCPGALVIAEESTAWPGVTQPVAEGGLGFAQKWNMGWMHDTLRYIGRDPVHRQHHHDDIAFGTTYAWSERYVLPLSHDEVVHGKGSLIGRIPGDRWQRFATLRAYFGLMWGYPGKKLLFMGGEFAQEREWHHDRALDWHLLDDPLHRGVQATVRDLNRLYAEYPALHARDNEPGGFQWLVVDDTANCVFAWLRWDADGRAPVLVACNFTPVPRHGYRIGAPRAGRWRELLNTDAALYGGSNIGNAGAVKAAGPPSHGQPCSLELTLPPLATVILTPEPAA